MNKRLKELGVSVDLKIDVQKIAAMSNKKLDSIPSEQRTFIKHKTLKLVAIAACVAVIGVAAATIAEKPTQYVIQAPKTETEVSGAISAEYYAEKERLDGMNLYVSDRNNFFIQIPADASVSAGVHIDEEEDINADTCTITFNHCILSVLYNYTQSGNQYTTIEEVINSYTEAGVHLCGKLDDFEMFNVGDKINGYKFCQYVSERLRIEHITYYTPDGAVGITVQFSDTSEEDEAVLSQCLDSILIK